MKIIKKLLSAILLSILMFPNVHAQKKYSPAEISADLDFMIKTLERRHVKLYFHLPKEEFLEEIEDIKKSIKDSLNAFEVWKLTAPVVAKLGDGHTSMYFPDFKMSEFQRMDNQIFPFKVKIAGEKLLVEVNYSEDNSICPGSEILTINNIPVAVIINEMIKYKSGEKESFRKSSVSNNFGLFLWALYNMSAEFNVRYISRVDNKEYNKVFMGVLYAKYSLTVREASGQTVPYSLELLNNETVALIDFRSFINLTKFKEFLKQTFKTIKEKDIKNLIIDIRKNGGGDSNLGDELINYLTDKPYRQCEKVEVKSTDTLKTLWAGTGVDVYKIELTIPHKPENEFNGKVFLLTGNSTFSSAGMFSSAFKCFNMGTIIGEETGGVTVSYGDVFSFYLPRTKIRCGVSFKHFWEACGKEDGKGVLPNYEVKQNPKDTEKGIDTVLEYTLSLIRKSETSN